MMADGAALDADGVTTVARALDAALDNETARPRPLGDPRAPDTIRRWNAIAGGIDDDALETVLTEAVCRLAATPPGQARVLAAGLMPEVPVQMALIAGYVRLYRRLRRIASDGGMDEAAVMADTRADMRRLNARMAEALTEISRQRQDRTALEATLERRERRLARANVDASKARDDLRAAQVAIAQLESERDAAQRTAAAATAERDGLHKALNRARAGVEDLKAKYLEKFALALHDLNNARALLINDPRSTLAASKASIAQGFYMILEDMGADAEAKKLMASILKDGM